MSTPLIRVASITRSKTALSHDPDTWATPGHPNITGCRPILPIREPGTSCAARMRSIEPGGEWPGLVRPEPDQDTATVPRETSTRCLCPAFTCGVVARSSSVSASAPAPTSRAISSPPLANRLRPSRSSAMDGTAPRAGAPSRRTARRHRSGPAPGHRRELRAVTAELEPGFGREEFGPGHRDRGPAQLGPGRRHDRSAERGGE